MSEDTQPPQRPTSPTGDGAAKFADVASPVKGRNVLIPVDGSPDSERAFIWYVNNMKRPSDNVRIYHRAEAVSLPLLNLSEGYFSNDLNSVFFTFVCLHLFHIFEDLRAVQS